MKYYNDTSIPLPRFIDATVDHDLTALLIETVDDELTEAEIEELSQALLKINSDYLLALGDSSVTIYTQRTQLIADTGLRILRFKLAVASLEIIPTQSKIEVLREEFPYDFNPVDIEAFRQDLQNVLTELTGDEIEFDRLRNIEEQEQEKEDKGTDAPQTRQGFRNLLFEINHMEGLKYNIEDLTLADLAELIKRLKTHYRNQQLKASVA